MAVVNAQAREVFALDMAVDNIMCMPNGNGAKGVNIVYVLLTFLHFRIPI